MRGGKRKNAGRKSKWENKYKFSETKVVRIPKKLANDIIKVGLYMDKNGLDFKSIMSIFKRTEQLNELTDTLDQELIEANQLIEEQQIEIANLKQELQELQDF